MMAIHETAVIDKKATIGTDNEIGPYVVIEGNVVIGDNNKIGPGTIITGNTTIGNNNHIHGHVYIGNLPQDLGYKGSETFLKIGNNNTLREFTTVHRGTKGSSVTIIGDNNYLMVSSHVAHNCRLGDNIVMVNGAGLAGHVEVFDHAFIGAFVVVHQFSKIGSYSICGILSKITKDVPPFMMVDGNPAMVRGLNLIGLKRKEFSPERREIIKKAYKILYRSGYSISHSLKELKNWEDNEDIRLLIEFIESSKRGILLKIPKVDS